MRAAAASGRVPSAGRGVLAFVLLAVSPLVVGEVSGEEPGTAADLIEQVRADVDGTSVRWMGVGRVRYSRALRTSVGVGAVAARIPTSHDCVAFCEYRGLVFHLEPGTAGGQVGVGYARVVAARPPNAPFLNRIYVGWSGRAVLVRTWGDSDLDPVRQTLAGFEAPFSVPKVSFTVAVLRRISSAHRDADDFVFTAGVGWGF